MHTAKFWLFDFEAFIAVRPHTASSPDLIRR